MNDPLEVMEQFPFDWLETASKEELLRVVAVLRASLTVARNFADDTEEDWCILISALQEFGCVL